VDAATAGARVLELRALMDGARDPAGAQAWLQLPTSQRL
jgi:hypothetical protein